jgi:hypothetical protein
MTDLNGECWHVIGVLGAGGDGSPLPPAAITRLAEMAIIEWRDAKPCLTTYGERAYVALESGDEFPGLE